MSNIGTHKGLYMGGLKPSQVYKNSFDLGSKNKIEHIKAIQSKSLVASKQNSLTSYFKSHSEGSAPPQDNHND